MGESSIGITDGTGSNLHTWTRTIASTSRQDQFTVRGEHPLTTYTAFATVPTDVANSHLMILQGDGTNYLRVRRITVTQANIATASTLDVRVFRTSTAGSGGTAVSARSFDQGDTSPYAGTIQTRPTSKGSEGDQLLMRRMPVAAAQPIGNVVEWKSGDTQKAIIAGNGTANGICIKNINSLSMLVDVEVEFTTTNYL